jgi:hypothetical protein
LRWQAGQLPIGRCRGGEDHLLYTSLAGVLEDVRRGDVVATDIIERIFHRRHDRDLRGQVDDPVDAHLEAQSLL